MSGRPSSGALTDFVVDYITAHGWPPSRREIAEHFGIGLQAAQNVIIQAVDDGYIEAGSGARMIRVVRGGARTEEM